MCCTKKNKFKEGMRHPTVKQLIFPSIEEEEECNKSLILIAFWNATHEI